MYGINIFSFFLSNYGNTRELEKAVEALASVACGSCSNSISRSLKLTLVFL